MLALHYLGAEVVCLQIMLSELGIGITSVLALLLHSQCLWAVIAKSPNASWHGHIPKATKDNRSSCEDQDV